MNVPHPHILLGLCLVGALGGCATSAISERATALALPEAWQREAAPGAFELGDLGQFRTPGLDELLAQALAQNRALAQQRSRVEAARQGVAVSRAARLPSLNLRGNGERGRATAGSAVAERFSLSASLAFELDVWGRLSDAQRQAALRLSAEEARYADLRRRTAAALLNGVFRAVAANQLLALFRQRLENLNESLDVIERSYRGGLSDALDVYLAQTTVDLERANIANQVQIAYQAAADLDLLLAEYPDGRLPLGDALPVLEAPVPAGLPSELIDRRADLQAAWFELLAADAGLALAHKSRFPSFNLTGTARDSQAELSDLLGGGQLAWTAAASLAQPLFQGGRLRALEAQARQRVLELEQRYLETVFAAFAEVENELSRLQSLQERHAAFEEAQRDAEAALEIASDRYRRGLVAYTTVLESQRRAFDAQTTVVQLRSQLLQSRVALQLALGGAVGTEG